MSRVIVTSDQHFGHANIIKYSNRPYKNVDDMDEDMIRRWNEKVSPEDYVYQLGDFTLGNAGRAGFYFRQLNGKINVVRGSHDDGWYNERSNNLYSKDGNKVNLLGDRFDYSSPLIGADRRNVLIVMSHYAMARWPISHYGSLHIFGHSHGHFEGIGKSMDVGVDIYPNLLYIEEVADILSRKTSPENHSK